MQFEVLESDDSCQPGPQYTNPRVVVEEHHGAPLLNCSGLGWLRSVARRRRRRPCRIAGSGVWRPPCRRTTRGTSTLRRRQAPLIAGR